jgi:hypothetical protein
MLTRGGVGVEGPDGAVEGGAWPAVRPGHDGVGSGGSSRSPHAWEKIGEGEPLMGGAA